MKLATLFQEPQQETASWKKSFQTLTTFISPQLSAGLARSGPPI